MADAVQPAPTYPTILIDDETVVDPIAVNTITIKDMEALSRGDLFELLAAKTFLQNAAAAIHKLDVNDLPQFVLIQITK